MKISAKGRYALAATTYMAQEYKLGEHITLISISEKLGISKIYLEQVFSLLKKANIILSTKGAQGGYSLARLPEQISVLEILSAVEVSLFEKTEDTVSNTAPDIESTMRVIVFDVLDSSVKDKLDSISLRDLKLQTDNYRAQQAPMYFI